jgi:hypothetical protein
MGRRLLHLLCAIAIVCTACRGEPAETYGFVATLGDDTTSVERVTRTGDRIVSEAVGRSPIVVRRRWEATLANDGTVARWTMDTEVPNASEGQTTLHHEAEFMPDRVSLVRVVGNDTTRSSYAKHYVTTVPWNAFLYASHELLFDIARGLPDTTQIGQYFFEGWAEGRIGYATVRDLGDNRYAIGSTGLAGEGIAELDDAGRMVSYSGEGTTYKQQVTRVTEVPDIDAVFERFAADERTRGVERALSLRDTVRATVGDAQVFVDYSRPRARGRTLAGGLIPHDRVWRTGANAATQFHTSAPVRLAGVPLDSGTYTLWTLPSQDSVLLVINRQAGQWGTGYQQQHDIARVRMTVDTTRSHVESFTVLLEGGRLAMEWGRFRWSTVLDR